jgi:glycosyltransferase involved in cell wall biosynthesis
MPDVILPVLNEAEALPIVLRAIPPGYRAIVVDNGSTDGSADVAAAFGATVLDEPRRGFGSACQAGLLAATDDVVCFMDCDGSLDPADLPLVCTPVHTGSADLVVGERIAERGAWPVHARVLNRLLAFEVHRRTGVRLLDIGPMRAARRKDLLALGIADRRFGWPLEMVLRAVAAGWRVTGVPIPYRLRNGRSKVTGTLGGTVKAIRDMSKAFR